MKFTKVQGPGNGYVCIDCFSKQIAKPEEPAVRIADRHFGVGGDGLILICPSEIAPTRMCMLSTDGSEGKVRGNGARCMACYAYDHDLVTSRSSDIEMGTGIRHAEVDESLVTIDMEEAALDGEPEEAITVDGKAARMTLVNVDNPHAICLVDSLRALRGLDLGRIGPTYKYCPRFPEGVNSEFLYIESPTKLHVWVYKHGSRETLTYSTGVTTVALAAMRLGHANGKVAVHLLGGDLMLEQLSDGHFRITGPAVEVFSGNYFSERQQAPFLPQQVGRRWCDRRSIKKEVQMKAYLLLEDGILFTGRSIGTVKEAMSEIIFNTSMTGYLEMLTDPSYAGQAVVMTYPLIGNCSICRENMESGRAWPDTPIIRELAELASNFRGRETLQQFLLEEDVPGIGDIDTRTLTKILRERNIVNSFLTTNPDFDREEAVRRIGAYRMLGAVTRVSYKEKYVIPGKGERVSIIDCGIKRNMLRELGKRSLELTIWPQDARTEDILAGKPDGIFLANGPGDPTGNMGLIREIKRLYDSEVPIFVICLGYQLVALATGDRTYKTKYGHRSGNHPVRDLESGRAYISAQSHGYAVDDKSLDPKVTETRFVNVNGGTNEGLAYCGKNVLTVQFHPEACPEPHDTPYLFDHFPDMMEVQYV